MLKYKVLENGLEISTEDNLMEKINELVKKHYPKEFGGIFIGTYSETNSILNLIDIISPKRFWNSGFLFIRYPRFINRKIREVFESSQGENIYVGEWHSHPNGNPIPSSKDISTMIKISNHKKINIASPILCIVSFDGKTFNHNFYLTIENKNYKYEKI